MRVVVKLLLIWLLAVAMPLQGFAAASMLPCQLVRHQMALASEQSSPHVDHHHGTGATGEVSHQLASGITTSQDHDGHHAAGKCNACSVCCMPVAMMAPGPLHSASLSFGSHAIPFADSKMRMFVPESLDPPPRSLLA